MQRDQAAEQALAPQRRSRNVDPIRPERERIAQLERVKALLERELAQARLIIGVKNSCRLARGRDGESDGR